MRRVAAACMGGLLLLAGCPSQQEIPAAVSILTAGTYTGSVNCTSKQTGQTDIQAQSSVSVQVTTAMQLYVSGLPYYKGAVQDMSDSAHGITGSLTVNDIVENSQTKTVTVTGSGSLSDGTVTFNTVHDIALVQSSGTQLQYTDDYSGQTTDAAKTFDLSCGGTLTMQ